MWPLHGRRPLFDVIEREQLADLFDELGPDAPTLLGPWTTRDLVSHLVLREHDSLAAPGLVVPGAWGRFAERRRRALACKEFPWLVATIRSGTPRGFFRIGWVRSFPPSTSSSSTMRMCAEPTVVVLGPTRPRWMRLYGATSVARHGSSLGGYPAQGSSSSGPGRPHSKSPARETHGSHRWTSGRAAALSVRSSARGTGRDQWARAAATRPACAVRHVKALHAYSGARRNWKDGHPTGVNRASLKLLGDHLVAVDENQTARIEHHRPSPRGANYAGFTDNHGMPRQITEILGHRTADLAVRPRIHTHPPIHCHGAIAGIASRLASAFRPSSSSVAP